ncbi:phage head closure protein [Hyphomicrobium sp. CS1BSMeth3]|uniref:phage head closure protein n=1 Tax=Hyphomicrobium sp. CS1BSMeth3 TaxID=1892844 RepID=UPI000930614D|nr:phage head closure protein [Hyphomicrobium sp. CS1BSMeth3]
MRASIGRLRHRLRLEAATRAPDGGGGAAETWATIAHVWCEIRPTGGSESVDADGLSGRNAHEITMRYRSGVTPAMRLAIGSRRFEIVAVLDVDERRRWLKCLCVERGL